MAAFRTSSTRQAPKAILFFPKNESFISTSVPTCNVQPIEETQDLRELDRLLNVVRQRSEPAFRSAMPMRSPVFWMDNLASIHSAGNVKDTAPSTASLPDDLEPRRMHDSYAQVVLPFASQPALLEKYVNARGGIRTGKIMEHLDSLAGSIAYKYVLGASVEKLKSISDAGFYIVTASIDRLDMLSPLTPKNVNDIRLSGQVISVGSSSMEIAVKMESIKSPSGVDETLLIGRFSMVCRDARTHKARKINPLLLEDANDRSLSAMGEAQNRRMKSTRLNALSRIPPSAAESALVHEFFVKHRVPDSTNNSNASSDAINAIEQVPMSQTALENTSMTHPQERNVHQKVFGGYLMRLAYEIGYSTAILFTGRTMRFLSLDNTTFKLPVSVGSILRLTSAVAHTLPGGKGSEYGTLVNIRVQADVIDVATGEEKNTNEFHFTWGVEGPEPLKKTVVPVTYTEAMHWLEARRELMLGAQIRGLRR